MWHAVLLGGYAGGAIATAAWVQTERLAHERELADARLRLLERGLSTAHLDEPSPRGLLVRSLLWPLWVIFTVIETVGRRMT